MIKRTPSYIQDFLELGIYLVHQVFVYGQHKLLLEQLASGLSFGDKICGDPLFRRIGSAQYHYNHREKNYLILESFY